MSKVSNIKIGNFNALCSYNFEVNEKSDFIIISYWWGRGNINRNSREGKTYDQLADRLIADCLKTGCNFFIAEIPEFAVAGGYQKAINYKPEFIINVITNIIPINIKKAVYIDTDMRVLQFPSLFNMKGYDFMGYNWNWEPRSLDNTFPMNCYDPYNLHTSGGLLLFANSDPSLLLLSRWSEEVKKNPKKAEDRMLSIPFNDEDMITILRCFWLPDEYFWLPYFFEYDDRYRVKKEYQRDFISRGINFINDTTGEINMSDFYGFNDNDIVIVHPELLTSEEMAAQQGADLDRVPLEWFKSQGRKKRCLTDLDKLVINPSLFLESPEDYLQMKNAYHWLSESHFAVIQNETLELSKKRLDIFKENLTYNSNILFVTALENEKNIPQSWLKIVDGYDYLILQNYNDLPSTLYTIMNKYKKDVIWLNINATPTKNFDGFGTLFNDIDFACLNANSFPYYANSMGRKCNDDRFLNCPTTDLLYFKNNRFGTNVLRVWKHATDDKVTEVQKLSKGFNKYGLILNTRVNWLSPGWMFNKSFISLIKGFEINIETNNPYITVDFRSGLDDYLIQCGEKKEISLEGLPYPTHYEGSRYEDDVEIEDKSSSESKESYEERFINNTLNLVKEGEEITDKFLIDTLGKYERHDSDIKLLILNTVCHGFGDIVFSMKLYTILRSWYPSISIQIASTKVDLFKQLGAPEDILLQLAVERGGDQCRRFKRTNFIDKDGRRINPPQVDLIFVAPLFSDFSVDYADVQALIPYSNKYNTYFFSEYNDRLDKGFDFDTGVGGDRYGMLFIDAGNVLPLPQLVNRNYCVIYIAENVVGRDKCFRDFIKMVVEKYSNLGVKELDIVVPQWITVEDISIFSNYILGFYDVINFQKERIQTIVQNRGVRNPKVLTFRADILPLPYDDMRRLFFNALPDALVTGDQSITDLLACCWKDKIPFYQVVPWKVDFAKELGINLPQKFIEKISTSCGDREAIDYFQQFPPDFLNFMKTWDFKILAKDKIDSIMTLTEVARDYPKIKEVVKIFTKTKDRARIIKKLEKINLNEQRVCANLVTANPEDYLEMSDEHILFLLKIGENYVVECYNKKSIGKLEKVWVYNESEQREEGYVRLYTSLGKVYINVKEIAALIQRMQSTVFYLVKDPDIGNPSEDFNVYTIKECGNAECLEKIF